jgi:hypothetical protein
MTAPLTTRPSSVVGRFAVAGSRLLLLAVQAVDAAIGWPFTEPHQRWWRKANWLGRKGLATVGLRLMRVVNDRSRVSVLGDGPPVSLTTYGRRIPLAFAAVESIGLGSVRPRRLVLWLDREADLLELDPRLARLVERGLEVKLSANYGPHTKYYPYVRDLWNGHDCLVTADDDIIYPPNWLALLQRGHRCAPADVQCHRGHRVRVAGGAIVPYGQWQGVRGTDPSPTVFATGVSGVIYPPVMLGHLKELGEAFRDRCPKADDIWLHYVAVENGIGIRQLRPRGRHFPVVADSQVDKLQNDNVTGSGNDRQIAATYTATAIARLSPEHSLH